MGINKLSIPSTQSRKHWNLVDLTGRSFGRLRAVRLSHTTLNGGYWICVCDCGTAKIVARKVLLNGNTKSCGCLRREASRERRTTHGKKSSVEYQAYQNAKRRCTQPTNIVFKYYGGRGIEFRFQSFEEFFAELGLRPDASYSIDRIDNDGHYEVGNVRWAKKDEQLKNRRCARSVTFRGDTKTIREWSESMHINQGTLKSRLETGWCVECSLTISTDLAASCIHKVPPTLPVLSL